ncbi:TetR/AcrR family transcriptional regulator [Streptomyces sp. V3I7]|uniref:TetR/AcrR family transcriptional regulator n=1 Tax=Streptomyces sp. V3I7 TaxID=3042278 RepID=UPI00278226E6|nr:TetR/AcrR family transcriptional regulator [Streptomyces sp. V3I7]MDQ0994044.1 AcrR family transcriptional regulator [Streptomyces sp. V3I7]
MADTTNTRAEADGRSTRWNAHKAKRQIDLIDAAVAAIEEEGPGVGVKQIAERIGLPRSVVYRHFKDRADLDELIRERIVASLMAELAPTLEPDGTVMTSIRRIIHAYLDWIGRNRRLHAFLGTDACAPGDGSGVVAGTKAAIAVQLGKLFAAVLTHLEKDASLAAPTAFGLVGFVDATVNSWLADKQPRLRSAELADFLACSIWSVLHGNLGTLGVEIAPNQPISELLDRRG